MKIFFDCEFYEDGRTIDLMSIGMVREDGGTYYAVSADYDFAGPLADYWHLRNTIPHLPLSRARDHEPLSVWNVVRVKSDDWKSRLSIREEIDNFVGDAPEFWGYYADYDWVCLCQLFGRMTHLPPRWPKYCRDLKQLGDDAAYVFRPPPAAEHHALADALWIKNEFEAIVRSTRPLAGAKK